MGHYLPLFSAVLQGPGHPPETPDGCSFPGKQEPPVPLRSFSGQAGPRAGVEALPPLLPLAGAAGPTCPLSSLTRTLVALPHSGEPGSRNRAVPSRAAQARPLDNKAQLAWRPGQSGNSSAELPNFTGMTRWLQLPHPLREPNRGSPILASCAGQPSLQLLHS